MDPDSTIMSLISELRALRQSLLDRDEAFNQRLDQVTERLDELAGNLKHNSERLDELAGNQKHTSERLDHLLHTRVDLFCVQCVFYIPRAVVGFRAGVYTLLQKRNVSKVRDCEAVWVSFPCPETPAAGEHLAASPPSSSPPPEQSPLPSTESASSLGSSTSGARPVARELGDPYFVHVKVVVHGRIAAGELATALAALCTQQFHSPASLVDIASPPTPPSEPPKDPSCDDPLSRVSIERIDELDGDRLCPVLCTDYDTEANPRSAPYQMPDTVHRSASSSELSSHHVSIPILERLQRVASPPNRMTGRGSFQCERAHLVAKADLKHSDRTWLNKTAANLLALSNGVHQMFDGISTDMGSDTSAHMGEGKQHRGIIAFAVEGTGGTVKAVNRPEQGCEKFRLRVYVRDWNDRERVQGEFSSNEGCSLSAEWLYDSNVELHYAVYLNDLFISKRPMLIDEECPEHRPAHWVTCEEDDDFFTLEGTGEADLRTEAASDVEEAAVAGVHEEEEKDEEGPIARPLPLTSAVSPSADVDDDISAVLQELEESERDRTKSIAPTTKRVRRYHHVFQDCLRESFLVRVGSWKQNGRIAKELMALKRSSATVPWTRQLRSTSQKS